MKYSLLCPTRGRAIQRQQLIKSIVTTAHDLSNIELLFAIDKDDINSQDNIDSLIKLYPQLNIKVFKRNRSIFLNKDYYNWLAGFANGDYVWVIADDLIFSYHHWDNYIAKRVDDYIQHIKDRILYIGLPDDTPKPADRFPKFPCFPMLTKEAIKALGFILHPQIPTWGADYVLYELFKKVGRLFILNEAIFLRHISYHTNQVEPDKVNKRIGNIFNQLKMIPMYNIERILREIVPQQVEYLKNIIEGRIIIRD